MALAPVPALLGRRLHRRQPPCRCRLSTPPPVHPCAPTPAPVRCSRPLHASPADFLVTCVKTAGDAELAALHNTYCALQAGWEAAGGGQASPPKHGSKESYGSLGSLGGSRGGTPTNTCACVADGGGCAACHAACAGHRPTGSSASASASASLKDSVSEQSGTDVESGTSSPELPATPELRVAAAPPTRRTAAAAAAAQLFMLQTWVLLVRHWRSTTRRRTALALDVAQKLFSAVFLGEEGMRLLSAGCQAVVDRLSGFCPAPHRRSSAVRKPPPRTAHAQHTPGQPRPPAHPPAFSPAAVPPWQA